MKNTTISVLLLVFVLFSASSCHKVADAIIDQGTSLPASGQFVKYTIPAGQQFCDQSGYQPVDADHLSFTVRFDSSAIYTTRSKENQFDINKLFGFSDNNQDHHQFSARFGWRWSDNALRLFAYIYNRGEVSSKEIGTVAIGQDANCSIGVSGDQYIFKLNETTLTMPRASTTAKAKGYRLFPYFGGDEAAPHDIAIWIRVN